MKTTKREKRIARHVRIGAQLKHAGVPRVSVYRSNSHLFVQIIDDATGKTLVSASDMGKTTMKGTKTERAIKIGEVLAEKAKKAGIAKVVFDRGGFQYHGRIKALAESLRKGELVF